MERSVEVPSKTKHSYHMIQQSHFWEYIQKREKKASDSKRHVHPNVHCSTAYNSRDLEAA